MNIDTFEKIHQGSTQETHHDFSSSHDDVASIKLKIEKKKSKQKKLKIVLMVLVGLVLLLTVLFVYSQYRLYTLTQEEVTTEGVASSTENKNELSLKNPEDIIKALGRHILLPEGTPQIAAVQDVEKLREKQAFFKNAQNGDIVVVYETTIFIYRPSADIVVASGDILGVGQTNP